MMKKTAFLLPAAALLGLAAPLLAADPSAPAASGAPAVDGPALFKQRCASCHSVEPGKSSGFGPNLAGVLGRQAAGLPDFRYSPALRSSNLTWTRENLDAYLAAPMKLVPGTRMVVGLSETAQRTAVLDYLASVSPGAAAQGAAPTATPAPAPTASPAPAPTASPDPHAGH